MEAGAGAGAEVLAALAVLAALVQVVAAVVALVQVVAAVVALVQVVAVACQGCILQVVLAPCTAEVVAVVH